MDKERRSSSTIVIHDEHKGYLVGLIVFSFFISTLLAWLVVSLSALQETFKETKTEVRILQMHVQDQNAILIRQGIIEPGDLTTGPTNPNKLKVKDERGKM